MNGAVRALLPIAALVTLVAVAHGEIYTWTDSRGTRHYTNSLYEVPTRYREKVKQVDLGLPEQKGAQQPGSPASAVAAPPAPAAPPMTVSPVEPPAKPAVSQPERRPRRERSRNSD
ncbi:MAG TPA: DUF4124 domain-containing protein, partial [Geobacteraceae bacterium]